MLIQIPRLDLWRGSAVQKYAAILNDSESSFDVDEEKAIYDRPNSVLGIPARYTPFLLAFSITVLLSSIAGNVVVRTEGEVADATCDQILLSYSKFRCHLYLVVGLADLRQQLLWLRWSTMSGWNSEKFLLLQNMKARHLRHSKRHGRVFGSVSRLGFCSSWA